MGKGKSKNEKHTSKRFSFDRFELFFAVLTLTFGITLPYIKQMLDPTLAFRLVFLSVTVLILLLFYLRYILLDKGPTLITGGLVYLSLLLYFIVSLISLFAAVNPSEGIFDLVKTFLCIILLFLLVRILQRHPDFFEVLSKSVTISAIFTASFGLYDYFKFAWGKSGGELYDALYNVTGLMTHKNQLAILLFMMLPYVLFGVIRFKGVWKALSSLAIIILIADILLLQTRSVWIAILLYAVSFLIFFLPFVIRRRIFNTSKRTRYFSGILITLALLAVFSFVYLNPGVSEVFRYKMKSVYNLDSESNRGRLEIGTSTVDMILDHPLLGVGAGNWKIQYPSYYAGYHGKVYKNWRRPHNDFLWVFAEKGVLGILLFISVFIIISYYYLHLLKQKDQSHRIRMISILMFSGVPGYFIISNFSFPLERITLQVYFFLLIAVVLALRKNIPGNGGFRISLIWLRRTYAIAFIALLFSLYYSISFFKSDHYSFLLIKILDKQAHNSVISLSKKAFSPFHTIDQINCPYHFYSGMSLLKQNRFVQSEKDCLKALEYHPNHFGNLFNLATVYGRMKDYSLAEHYYRKVLGIFPFYEEAKLNLVRVLVMKKRYGEAYKMILEILPPHESGEIAEFKKQLEDLLDAQNNSDRPAI